jgi:stearoyl-CoA desaturase (delta-9 desaturase)
MKFINAINHTINVNKFRIFLSLLYIVSVYAIGLVIFGDVSAWWLLAGLVWSKIVQLVGHNIGMHRYFSHKSFNTTPMGEKLMAWTSVLLGIGSPIQYVRNHRQHHKVTDKPTDWHSPVVDGKLYTALGIWEFNNRSWFEARGGMTPRDLVGHPTYRFIHDHYYKIWTVLTLVTLLINWHITLFLLAIPSLIFHIEMNLWFNCVGHSWGYRNFNTNDESRNNKWLQIFTLGEGLHNNHHANAQLYNYAVKKGESDISAWVIDKFLAVPGQQTTQGKITIN